MTTASVTAKGQVVIPSRIRKHLNIKAGTRLVVLEEGNKITFQPLNKDYFEQFAGILRSKKDLVKELQKERRNEEARMDKKWSKLSTLPR